MTFQPLAAGEQGRAGEGLQLESRLHQVEDNESGLRYNGRSPDPGKDPDRPAWSGRFSIRPAGDSTCPQISQSKPNE